MKYLKKINELFDFDELKHQHEIPYLQGNLLNSYKEINSEGMKIDKIMISIPLFILFVNDYNDKNHFIHHQDSIYTFVLQNDEYVVNYAIDLFYKDKFEWAMVIFKKSLNNEPQNIFKKGGQGSFDDFIHFTNEVYIPTIDRLGFKEEIKYNKEILISSQN